MNASNRVGVRDGGKTAVGESSERAVIGKTEDDGGIWYGSARLISDFDRECGRDGRVVRDDM